MGTSLGALCALFVRNKIPNNIERILTGFAAGVMVSASIWSLLLPAIDQAKESLGRFAVLPACVGFWIGVLFLLLLDHLIPHLHRDSESPEGPKSALPRSAKMVLAVTLHNIPEGMAVGVVVAGWLCGTADITFAAAMILAVGIAIQNWPEGVIVAVPLRGEGMSRLKSTGCGILSGIVEPIGALITIAMAAQLTPFLPYFLGFAAGAMLYVVVEELIPEMSKEPHSNMGTMAFAAGFTLMMLLDVVLG